MRRELAAFQEARINESNNQIRFISNSISAVRVGRLCGIAIYFVQQNDLARRMDAVFRNCNMW
jgi:hypothetical protein